MSYLQTEFPADIFQDNSALTELIADSTKSTTLDANVFQNTPVLKKLAFGGMTPLSFTDALEIPAGLFDSNPALENVDIYHTRLSSLPIGLFDATTNLNFVRIQAKNALTSFPAGFFSQNTALTSVYLQEMSSISFFPSGTFENLPLTQLTLDSTLKCMDSAASDCCELPVAVHDATMQGYKCYQAGSGSPTASPPTVAPPTVATSTGGGNAGSNLKLEGAQSKVILDAGAATEFVLNASFLANLIEEVNALKAAAA